MIYACLSCFGRQFLNLGSFMSYGRLSRWFVTIQNPQFSDGVLVDSVLSRPLFLAADFDGCVDARSRGCGSC